MHSWEDTDVDWVGLSDAAYWIGYRLGKWGRISVSDMKEKYGTVRVYCYFGWTSFHTVIYPLHHYSQFPKWLWKLDCYIGYYLIRPLNWIVRPIQSVIYRAVYKEAIRKWPHLAQEILTGADHMELLVGLHPDLIYDKVGPNTFRYGWQGDVMETEEVPDHELI